MKSWPSLYSAALLLLLPYGALAEVLPRFYHDTKLSGSPFMVEAETCDQATAIYSALEKWKQHLGEIQASSTRPSGKKTSRGCELNLESAAPAFVKKYQGVKVTEDWGNCWGTVLAAAGMIPDFIDTHSMEESTSRWVESPLCKLVPPGQSPQPGDIMAIGRVLGPKAFKNEHGMIYLGEGLVFSKNDGFKDTPFALQPLTEVLKLYPRLKGKECMHANPLNYGMCGEALVYYRCETMEQFTRKNGLDRNQNISSCMAKVDVVEKSARQRALRATSIPFDDLLVQIRGLINPIGDYAAAQSQAVGEKIKKGNPSAEQLQALKDEQFIWDTLQFRAQAVWGGM